MVQDAHDPRMPQPGQQPRLDLEPQRVALLQRLLDRDQRIVAQTAGAIHRAHTAGRDRRLYYIFITDLGPGREDFHGRSLAW